MQNNVQNIFSSNEKDQLEILLKSAGLFFGGRGGGFCWDSAQFCNRNVHILAFIASQLLILAWHFFAVATCVICLFFLLLLFSFFDHPFPIGFLFSSSCWASGSPCLHGSSAKLILFIGNSFRTLSDFNSPLSFFFPWVLFHYQLLWILFDSLGFLGLWDALKDFSRFYGMIWDHKKLLFVLLCTLRDSLMLRFVFQFSFIHAKHELCFSEIAVRLIIQLTFQLA